MADEQTPEQNQESRTPETLGAIPRYVLQPNAVSRGAQGLSATARKLAAMAMALLPTDLSTRTAAFTFAEFCKALGYERGGESYKIFKDAVDECMRCVIHIETDPDEKGKKEWKKFTWFTVSSYSEKTEQATMTFSSELAEFLAALRWMYARINLKDLGDLQSRYAIHLFEIAMSYRSLAGRNGNPGDAWYFEREFPGEIRKIMGVKQDAYKDAHLLKQKVIDKPVKEINEAGIGVAITPSAVKQGRRIVAIRFDCAVTPRAGRRGRKAAADPPDIPAVPGLTDETAREDRELERLKEQYPEEFAERYAEALASRPAFLKASGIGEAFAESRALLELKEQHGLAP